MNNMMTDQQLEMGFEHRLRRPSRPRRPSRCQRAQWWFNRMRAVVNQALDWNPAPPARAEQIYLVLARGRQT